MNKFKKYLFFDANDWKSTGLTAVAIWVAFVLLESFLFSLAMFLVKFALVALGTILVFQTGYLLYPIFKKKIGEK